MIWTSALRCLLLAHVGTSVDQRSTQSDVTPVQSDELHNQSSLDNLQPLDDDDDGNKKAAAMVMLEYFASTKAHGKVASQDITSGKTNLDYLLQEAIGSVGCFALGCHEAMEDTQLGDAEVTAALLAQLRADDDARATEADAADLLINQEMLKPTTVEKKVGSALNQLRETQKEAPTSAEEQHRDSLLPPEALLQYLQTGSGQVTIALLLALAVLLASCFIGIVLCVPSHPSRQQPSSTPIKPGNHSTWPHPAPCVVHRKPSTLSLVGGYRFSDTVYFLGEQHGWASGNRVFPGLRGTVSGQSQSVDRMAVLFSGNPGVVDVLSTEVTRSKAELNHLDGEVLRLALLGVPVTRGPDWAWGDQDGEGVGSTTADGGNGWVEVQWQSTQARDWYRVGAENKFDLCISLRDADSGMLTTSSAWDAATPQATIDARLSSWPSGGRGEPAGTNLPPGLACPSPGRSSVLGPSGPLLGCQQV